jgi:hypothetical protein
VVQATLTGTASDFHRSAIFSCLSMPSRDKRHDKVFAVFHIITGDWADFR